MSIGCNHDHDGSICSSRPGCAVRGTLILLKIILQVIVSQFLGNRRTGDAENPAEISLHEHSDGVAPKPRGKPS